MFTTQEVAAACGVETVTVRSWLARAPGFHLGEYRGTAKVYNRMEATTLVIASELIGRGLGVPYEILPIASRIARMAGTVWVSRDRDGALYAGTKQPDDVAIAIPLPALAARLDSVTSSQRIARTTR